jgi:putative oxygen-independent coproporphyrinogen III oxidase
MHGLPQQDVPGALADLQQAIALAPPHLSWYQLTIEPNTAFASRPPTLPADDTLWDIQQQGMALLQHHGYQQYEISAYAKVGHQCRHNLNYWRFGDYLGIGCGAHGKVTQPEQDSIVRTVKIKHPKGYMDISRGYLDSKQQVVPAERPFEFFMNRFRLLEPCPHHEFTAYTGLKLDSIQPAIDKAVQQGLLQNEQQQWQITDKGARYLNNLLSLFID